MFIEAKFKLPETNKYAINSLICWKTELQYVLSGHSANVGSSQLCPAAFRGIALFFVSALCSTSLLAKAAFTLSSASGVIVWASLWNSCCAYQHRNHNNAVEVELSYSSRNPTYSTTIIGLFANEIGASCTSHERQTSIKITTFSPKSHNLRKVKEITNMRIPRAYLLILGKRVDTGGDRGGGWGGRVRRNEGRRHLNRRRDLRRREIGLRRRGTRVLEMEGEGEVRSRGGVAMLRRRRRRRRRRKRIRSRSWFLRHRERENGWIRGDWGMRKEKGKRS